MLPRIDTAKIAERKDFQTKVDAAVTRLQVIETGYATMTAAQKNAAVADLAKYLRLLIRYST